MMDCGCNSNHLHQTVFQMKNARPAHQDGRLILFLFRDLFRHLETDE